jgi:hypothetical protein
MDVVKRYPMDGDQVIGDGGNLTIYERPDETRYALDKRGQGREYEASLPVFGRARFDSREQSSGAWEGSRSERQNAVSPDIAIGAERRSRRRGSARASRA